MIKKTMKRNTKRNNEMKQIKKNIETYTNHPVITAPQIDNLSGVVDLKDAAYCGLVFGNILDLLNDHELGIIKASVAGKYALSIKIVFPNDEGLYPSSLSISTKALRPKI